MRLRISLPGLPITFDLIAASRDLPRRRYTTGSSKTGRLNDADATNRYGTNVIPLGMSQAELRRGFIQLMANAYTTKPISRASTLSSSKRDLMSCSTAYSYWLPCRLAWAAQLLGDYIKFIVISLRLLRHVKDPVLRKSKATGARPASLVAQPPHAVRLCDENGAAFSLRGNDAGLRMRHDRRWRYPRGLAPPSRAPCRRPRPA